MTRARYQQGSLKRIRRKGGRHVWVFRWRETDPDGKQKPRKIVVGSTDDLRTKDAAWDAVVSLRLNINQNDSVRRGAPQMFGDLVEHYRNTELNLNRENEWKAYSTKLIYGSFLENWIVPHWGKCTMHEFRNGIAVQVEQWLTSIKRARGTKAKIRNIMSAVCSHAIRYGWMSANPIASVRQRSDAPTVPTP